MALAPSSPGMVSIKAMIAVAQGNLDSARALVRAAYRHIDPGTLLPFIANYQDLYWVQDDGQRLVRLGVTLAYLGRKSDALREGKRGLEVMPISRDGYFGPYVQLQLARIYILVGEPELALDQLEPLLRVPFYLSPGWLRIDPAFHPLRKNPRFQKLAAGG